MASAAISAMQAGQGPGAVQDTGSVRATGAAGPDSFANMLAQVTDDGGVQQVSSERQVEAQPAKGGAESGSDAKKSGAASEEDKTDELKKYPDATQQDSRVVELSALMLNPVVLNVAPGQAAVTPVVDGSSVQDDPLEIPSAVVQTTRGVTTSPDLRAPGGNSAGAELLAENPSSAAVTSQAATENQNVNRGRDCGGESTPAPGHYGDEAETDVAAPGATAQEGQRPDAIDDHQVRFSGPTSEMSETQPRSTPADDKATSLTGVVSAVPPAEQAHVHSADEQADDIAASPQVQTLTMPDGNRGAQERGVVATPDSQQQSDVRQRRPEETPTRRGPAAQTDPADAASAKQDPTPFSALPVPVHASVAAHSDHPHSQSTPRGEVSQSEPSLAALHFELAPSHPAAVAARAIEAVRNAEMRVGWHSEQLGRVDIRTELRGHEVSAAMRVENEAGRQWLTAELPRLSETLERHQLNLVSLQVADFSHTGSHQQNDGHARWGSTVTPQRTSHEQGQVEAESLGLDMTQQRVSIRV